MCPDTEDSSDTVPNPKLEAIRNIKETATASQNHLAGLSSSAGTTADQIDEGLTEAVWTSPVADDYRTKISEKVGASDAAIQSIISDLTSAEDDIVESRMEKVPRDSAEARWPKP